MNPVTLDLLCLPVSQEFGFGILHTTVSVIHCSKVPISPRRHSSPYVRVPLRIGLILPGVFLLIYPPFQVSKKIGFLCYINTLEPKQERTRCESQTR
ncbi:unnamed protein product [Arabidopsis thaliana]|uniref:Uncharacterized protein n=1 Tax=Arabidopsis thaliana TaxID=3702 RepID=A0A5S9WV81_ARATH|nr:unnamed protein product [Arabidopsis thaliana]